MMNVLYKVPYALKRFGWWMMGTDPGLVAWACVIFLAATVSTFTHAYPLVHRVADFVQVSAGMAAIFGAIGREPKPEITKPTRLPW